MAIHHDIPLKIQSSPSNCIQTSVSQFLSFYGINVSPDEIEQKIPVRVNGQGKPMGTLLADIGTWLKKTYQLKPTMHVFDAQIIDRSWFSLSQQELLAKMQEVKVIGANTALTPYAPILIDAYITYLQGGGRIDITKCTHELLQKLLSKGPILAIVNFNYIYDYPKVSYDKKIKSYVPDTVGGKMIEHAIVLTGFDDGVYFYNDPDSEKGGKHQVENDVLVGAICTAQINSDNYLLTIEA